MDALPAAAVRRAELVLPARIDVVAWSDPLVDDVGFGPRDAYVELCWLPTIGPSATWLYRRLTALALKRPDGAVVDIAELAVLIGLSPSIAVHAPAQRSLRRLVHFGLARWTGRYAVRTTTPPLSRRQADRLPAQLQAVHHTLTAQPRHRNGR
jgi:hypothetical protein